VAVYATVLGELSLAAFPDFSSESRDAILREHFLMGLIPEIRKHVILGNPVSFEDAQAIALRAEAVEAAAVEVVIADRGYSDPVATVDKVLHFLTISCGEPGSSASVGAKGSPKSYGSTGNGRGGGSNIVYFHCKDTGHIKQDCPKRGRGGSGSGRGRGSGSSAVCPASPPIGWQPFHPVATVGPPTPRP
jgi:hypothetical protein